MGESWITMRKLIKHFITGFKISYATVMCALEDPMRDHTINWDKEGNVTVTHGHKWTYSELYNHFFGPRIQK